MSFSFDDAYDPGGLKSCAGKVNEILTSCSLRIGASNGVAEPAGTGSEDPGRPVLTRPEIHSQARPNGRRQQSGRLPLP
jgi:hypothetical protein